MKKSLPYACITILLWSAMAPLVKTMLVSLPNLETLSVSSFLAFLVLLLFNAATGRLKLLKTYRPRQYAAMAGLGAIGVFLYHALYYRGLHELSVQEACIINYLWPVMIVVFSIVILKEALTLPKVLAMACSFAGVVILSAGSGFAGTGDRLLGMFCCLGAAVLYGLFSVLNKKLDYDQNIAMMIFWLVGALGAGLLGLFTEDWVPVTGVSWVGIAVVGVLSDAVAYLLWALALRGAENTAVIANLAFLVPFLSVVFSAIFLKEEIRPRALIALVFIVGGILLQNLWGGKNGKRRS